MRLDGDPDDPRALADMHARVAAAVQALLDGARAA
jgi:hypothetical protein